MRQLFMYFLYRSKSFRVDLYLFAAATAEKITAAFAEVANESDYHGKSVAVVEEPAYTAVFAYAENEKNYE